MALIALMMTISTSAQFYIYFSDGTVAKVDSISMIAPEEPNPGTPDTPAEPETPSQGIGVFSVSATKQVTFSPGNLQYTQSTNTWSFASTQYECLGTDNVTGGSVSSDQNGDSKSGDALADKIDLFGWSTSVTDFGVGIYDDDNNDYSGSFVDWGTNKIGDDAPNTWRTLTADEWNYLRKSRPNANDLVGVAQVNGVNGLIFLPDNWVCPPDVTFRSGFHSDEGVDYFAPYQIFNADQWANLESAGAVFLPAAGYRNMTYGVGNVYGLGNYWSAVKKDSESPYYFFFYSSRAEMGSYNRLLRQSVRLVKDVEGENIDPEQPGEGGEEPEDPNPNTGNHEYVDLGLSVKWATCNVGATKPEEYGDYFAWGETEPKDYYDWSTYKWCNGSYDTQTKYCTNSSYGTVDNKTVLDKEDDAAAVNWGGNWRMPTDAEMTELRNNCTWTWTTQNGVKGYQVTGPNGNSIFLPAAGCRRGSSLDDAGSYGVFWSSSLLSGNPHIACALYFNSDSVNWYRNGRRYGPSVRPVCP